MKLLTRLTLAVLLILGAALPVAAQYTVVSSTGVTDSAGIVYNSGTYSITLVNNTGQPPYFQGVPLPANLAQYSGGLTTAGAFSATIPSNAFVLAGPGGPASQMTWNFSVCAKGGLSCYSVGISVSGATQNVTSTINAAAIPLTFSLPGVPPGPIGNAVVVNSGGFSYGQAGGGQPVSPNLGLIYASANCSGQTNCITVVPDAKTCNAVTTTATSANLSISASCPPFSAADVGKTIFVSASCVSGLAYPITVELAQTTIATFVDAQHVTTTATATNTAAGNACGSWGTLNDTQFSAIDTAIAASTVCPVVIFPAGGMMVASPHFTTQPSSCSTGDFGTRQFIMGGGIRFTGQGQYSTDIYLVPNFSTASCNAGTIKACFGYIQGSQWENMAFVGGNFSEVGGASSVTLFGLAIYEVVNHVLFAQFAGHNTAVWGLQNASGDAGPSILDHVQIDGFGGKCLGAAGASNSIALEDFTTIEDCSGNATSASGITIGSGSTVSSQHSVFQSVIGAPVGNFLIDNSGIFYSQFDNCGLNGATNAGNCLKLETGSTSYLTQFFVPGWTTSQAIYNHGGKLFLTGLVGPASVAPLGSDNGATCIDGGGNNFGTAQSGCVNTFGSSSITGTALATGNVAISACGTSTASGFLGGSQRGQFTITFAGTATTSCTATVTFPNAFLAAPVCSWKTIGGTNTAPTSMVNGTITALTTGGMVETYAAAWTAGNTNIVEYQCSNP